MSERFPWIVPSASPHSGGRLDYACGDPGRAHRSTHDRLLAECNPWPLLTCGINVVCDVLIRNMIGSGSRPGETPIDTTTPSHGALTRCMPRPTCSRAITSPAVSGVPPG